MANYNLTQTGDEVQAYIDSIPVIDVTGTLSGSNIVFATNPYSQIAANYAADCGSIVRLTVGTAVYLLRVTKYDGTNYTAAEMSGAHNVVATIGASSASATIDAGIDATPTQGSDNLVKSGGVYEKIKDLPFFYQDKEIAPVIVNNKYITTTGSIASLSGFTYAYFPVESGDIIIVSYRTNSVIAAISLTNNDLSPIIPVVNSVAGTHTYTYVCEQNGIIIVCGNTNTLSYRVIHSRLDEEIGDSGLRHAIKRVFPTYNIINGGYWSTSGVVNPISGWSRTSGFALKKGSVIYLSIKNASNIVSLVTELDANGNFVRTILAGDGINSQHQVIAYIDKDGFYALTGTPAWIERYIIIEYANGELLYQPPLDNLFLKLEDNFPREILRSPSFVGIVHKWGFIGDSLASGEQAVHNDNSGTLIRFDKYDYSWGQRLMSLNGVEGYNFSAGGYTAKQWCQGNGERMWGGAQLPENFKEAYCIALGVNDSNNISVGDVSTDIDLSDYNNNADTFVGWYAGIIQRLRSVNPKCRVFCLTIPYNQTKYNNFSAAIRLIVPLFTKCYLVDLAAYHYTPSGLSLNDHLSPAGYQWAAFEINTLLDWIIRHNLNDFKDIAFVGTDYSE